MAELKASSVLSAFLPGMQGKRIGGYIDEDVENVVTAPQYEENPFIVKSLADNPFEHLERYTGGKKFPTPEGGKTDAIFYALSYGARDSVRGAKQRLGIGEEDMKREDEYLKFLMDEYGEDIQYAYYGGLVADPVGWAIPASKLRHLGTVSDLVVHGAKAGALSGALSGSLAYIDPESQSLVDPNRPPTVAENIATSTVAGTVAGPVFSLAGKGIAKAYEPIGESLWKLAKTPEGAGALAGGAYGLYSFDPNANWEERSKHMVTAALIGGATGATPRIADTLYAKATGGGKISEMLPALRVEAGGTTYGTKPGRSWKERELTLREGFGTWFSPYYKLNDEVIHAIRQFRGKRGKYFEDWKGLLQGLEDMPIEDRKLMYRMLDSKTQGIGTDDFKFELSSRTAEARDKITEYSEALVDMGMLSEDVFLKNADNYLRRSYTKYEVDGKRGYDPENPFANDPVSKVFAADHLYKMRGKVQEIPIEQWAAKRSPDKEEFDMWEALEFRNARGETVDSAADATSVRVRRDWTKAERTEYGEIEDAPYALYRTGIMLSNDRALGEFFDQISRSVAKDPRNLPIGNLRSQGYVKIPDRKEFGNLGGKYVDKWTHGQIMKMREVYNQGVWSKVKDNYKFYNGIWKGLKTIAQPVVHFNNLMSSGAMYDLAGGRWSDVPRIARSLIKDDELAQKMKEDGVIGSSFMTEIDEARKKTLESYASFGEKLKITGPKEISGVLDFVTRNARKYIGGTWDTMGNIYQWEDNIWRAALYKTKYDEAIAKDFGEEKARQYATRYAKEFFVDYDQETPVLSVMRNTALPFFSYTYGTVPRIVESAIKNPAGYAKWAGMFWAMNQIGEEGSGFSSEYFDRMDAALEPNRMFGFMPVRPEITLTENISSMLSENANDIQVLNMSRATPLGAFDFSDPSRGTAGKIEGVPGFLQPSGGVAGAIAGPALGVDLGFGGEIPEGERMDRAYKNLVPNLSFIPGTWAAEKRMKADNMYEAGKTGGGPYEGLFSSKTEDDWSPTTARLSEFGIRVEPRNLKKSQYRAAFPFKEEIKAIEKQMRDLKEKKEFRMLPSNEKEEIMAELYKQKREVIRRAREKGLNIE